MIMGYPKKTVIATVIIVVVALGSFYVGTRYEKNKLIKIIDRNEQQADKKIATLTKEAQKPPVVANQIIGTVTKIDKNLLTITLADNAPQVIVTTPTTTYGETGTGKITDIAIGGTIAAIHTGVKNADGSYTAAAIKPAPVITAETTPTSKKSKTKKSKDSAERTTDAAPSESNL